MNPAPEACARHRDLVAAAFGDDPADEVLERYATEVPSCPDCRRRLALRLGVHPGRVGAESPAARDVRGMADLAGALRSMDGTGLDGRFRLENLRTGPTVWVAGALVAAALVGWLVGPPRWDAGGDRPSTPAAVALPPSAERSPVAPVDMPLPPAPERASPVDGPPVVAAPPVRAPRLASRAPPAPPAANLEDGMSDDGVADADWRPPPFEDLRRGALKSAPGAVGDSVQLVVHSPTGVRVGGRVGFTVIASTPTALALCVDGPERGIVWRGVVDGGRTALTTSGLPRSFDLSASGRYRFSLSMDVDGCTDPAHMVEVEVP